MGIIAKMGSIGENTKEQRDISMQQGVVYSNLGVILEGNQSTVKIDNDSSQSSDAHSSKNLLSVKSDEELQRGDRSSLLEHNQQYTELLNAYVKDFKKNSENKIKNKQKVFVISMVLFAGIPVFSLILIAATLVSLCFGCITGLDALPELLAALTSLLGTFMAIPKIITKYLFNKNEETHLAEIINKIQDYDRDIRGRM